MKVLFALFSILTITVGQSQNDVIYTNFIANKTGRAIRIDFMLNAGSTCYGIFIERGNDSNVFQQIGSIPGQCGSPSEPIIYSFTDESPILNSLNYYRLNFGGANFSDVISINYIATTPKIASVYPNPSNGIFDINFDNESQEHRQIEIISNLGNVVYSSSTNSENIPMDLTQIPKGVYHIRIYDDKFISLIAKGILIIQ